MEFGVKNESNNEAYNRTALGLYDNIANLFEIRDIPQVYEHVVDSYQKYHLDEDEIHQAGSIFNHYILDAPQELSISFGKRIPTIAEPKVFSTIFITSVANELHTTYELWIIPDDENPVTLSKSLVRIYDSPTDYKIGLFSSPAVIHEPVDSNPQLDQNEFDALDELLKYLSYSK